MAKSWRYNPSAVASALLSDSTPAVEGAPTAGAMGKASRGDHKHQRLSVTAKGTLDANGQAVIAFMRDGVAVSFPSEPAVTCMSVGAVAAVDWDFAFTTDGQGAYTGGTLTGRKGQALPAMTQLSALAILGGVITGVNNALAALGGFNPFNGSASGVKYSFIAIGPS